MSICLEKLATNSSDLTIVNRVLKVLHLLLGNMENSHQASDENAVRILGRMLLYISTSRTVLLVLQCLKLIVWIPASSLQLA